MMTSGASGRQRIYLSPHHDDIAFSLGALVAREPGGTLVDLFTRSGYVAGMSWRDPISTARVDEISALRRLEDAAFAERFALERLDLGLAEPSLHGRDPFAAGGVAEDAEALREPLAAALAGLLERGPCRVFCPAAIGGHVNHLATRAVVLELWPALGAGHELLFYEDLPYAGSRRKRRRGLADLRTATGGRMLRRAAWRAGADKLAAVNLYPSQHKAPLRSLWRFSPSALWPIGPHEAVWALTTS